MPILADDAVHDAEFMSVATTRSQRLRSSSWTGTDGDPMTTEGTAVQREGEGRGNQGQLASLDQHIPDRGATVIQTHEPKAMLRRLDRNGYRLPYAAERRQDLPASASRRRAMGR